jgi:hypothetical protein
MTIGSGTLYFVLREGSTREEQWSWRDIEDLCRAGELGPRARIFLPDEDRWATIGETRLGGIFEEHGRAAEGGAAGEERAKLEAAYREALERAGENPDQIEAQLDAAVLAAQLDRKDEARAHFQTALHRFPYHARAAQEVKRRFTRSEQKAFRYLDRPAPVWEDVGELATMPLGRGPLYVIVPAAVLTMLMWAPFGGGIIACLVFLWAFQIMEYTARGATKPAEWNRSFKDPWRKLARPALLMAMVVGQWLLVLYAAAKAAMFAQHSSGVSPWAYAGHSPLFLVIGSIVGVLYLPAAMVSIGGFTGSVGKTLDPRRLVRTIVRMEHEYVYSVALMAVIGGALALIRLTLGVIPVFGNIVFGAALAFATPMLGLILGRLLGRMAHVIE